MTTALARRALLWLFGALLVVTLPHLWYLPLWLLAVLAVCLWWRFRVYQGKWSMPAAPVRWALVVASVVALALDYRRLIGLEPTTSALVLACALKTLELKDQRDYLVVVLAAYFLAAGQLLFSQEIVDALIALSGILMLTAALVARHQGEPERGFPNPLALAAKMLLQAIPLMLVLFLVFPRLAPLWAVPQQGTQAKTGPSESMSPGDFARLGGSDDVAFRVSFDNEVPQRAEMYWRGLVFSEFDGRTWRQGTRHRMESFQAQTARSPQIVTPDIQPGDRTLGYEVVLEPTNQNWAYVLGYPLRYDDSLVLGSDARLMTRKAIGQRLGYRVTAHMDAVVEPQLRELSRPGYLQLPDGFNPRSVSLAREWRSQSVDDDAYIDRVLAWFGEEAFIYTLEPGLLGRHSIDEFLFLSRRGFCEHYASAFTFLMRAAGIPARVVAGYQGGARNALQGYWVVHQYDAHAWTEVWLAGRGWVRVDPTSAVSPLRIESGLEGAVGGEFLADEPLSLRRYQGIPFAAWVSMRWDMINYQWARLVLQYDDERQMAVLGQLLGKVTTTRLALVLLGCGALVLAYVTLGLFGWRSAPRHDPATRVFLDACAALQRRGLSRETGEAPLDFARRVAATLGQHPAADDFCGLCDVYVSLAYRRADMAVDGPLLRELRLHGRRFGKSVRRLGGWH